MEPSFWLSRWVDNKLGFHQEKINSRLRGHWHHTATRPNDRVFVPLCGKTQDMLWLRDQGYNVLGVELSEIACRQFFQENEIDFEEQHETRYLRFVADRIELLAGDFFSLEAEDLSAVTGVYDRAALIALPESMRREYALKLAALLPPGTRILLIGMAYDIEKMAGPPFSVEESEVIALFESAFKVDIIARSSGPEIVGNLAERGLDTLNETVFLLSRRD